MVALRHVEIRGGKGQVIDVCLFESMFSFIASEPIKHRVSGTVSNRLGNQEINTAPRNIYQTSDGQYLALSGSVQSMFERLLTVIGRPELIEDPRFITNEERVKNWESLDEIIGNFIAKKLEGEE